MQDFPNILQLFQNELNEAEKEILAKTVDLDVANEAVRKFSDINVEVRNVLVVKFTLIVALMQLNLINIFILQIFFGN